MPYSATHEGYATLKVQSTMKLNFLYRIQMTTLGKSGRSER